MLSVFGDKLQNAHGLGQKKNSLVSKVKKVAITGAKVLGGTIGVLGAIGAVAGFDQPGVTMTRQRGGLERAIRG
jgi:hypothetical protein